MTTSVSVNDKMKFLQWLTNNFNIKDWESFRIIHCFINDPTLLANISFVRNANYCPRSLLITNPSAGEILFYYKKQGMTVRDKEKIFHDIRFHKHEALYIQLRFHKDFQSPEYVSVLEENPYAPPISSMTQEEKHLVEQLFIESHSLASH